MARKVKVERTVEVDVLELANGATMDAHPGGGYVFRSEEGIQIRLQQGDQHWIASVVNGPPLVERGINEDEAMVRLAEAAATLEAATAVFAADAAPGQSEQAPGQAKKN